MMRPPALLDAGESKKAVGNYPLICMVIRWSGGRLRCKYPEQKKSRTQKIGLGERRSGAEVGSDAGFARQSENDKQADERQDQQHENAAFGPGGSPAHQRRAHRMRGEKMMLDHQPAIRHAIQEGLRPIPRGVKANRPPQRAGAPETQAENQSSKAGRKQTDRRFARIAAVAQSEER